MPGIALCINFDSAGERVGERLRWGVPMFLILMLRECHLAE